ncbi:hypothetical protein [Planobispora takensis]|uniref:DUF3108 domain-containing protein n=1 Tax=Planobispora takensis TaxID=1367882 RepID=A0A8J3T664_9ACTN|nr:hypothetical protein [Planobispora takensis]GII01714.1 hypothetical protein Pta02_37220 [Planobispora takensis]
MRRWVVPAVAVLLASVPVTASPAAASTAVVRAGAPDPVRAVDRQSRDERGVRISETSRYFFGEKSKVSGSGTRISGDLQLSPSGPVAAKFTWWNLSRPKGGGLPSEKSEPYRVIRVGKNVYDSRNTYPGPVPEGRKWIRFPNDHRGAAARDMAQDASLQPIDLYDPATMKAVLKCSTSTPVSGGFLYRGTIGYRELSKVSKGTFLSWTSGRPVTAKSKGKVSWRLWTDRRGLPTRLVTTDTVGTGKDPLVKRSDTRYTRWGSRLVVTAPPADEVIGEAALREYVRRQNEPIPEDSGNT